MLCNSEILVCSSWNLSWSGNDPYLPSFTSWDVRGFYTASRFWCSFHNLHHDHFVTYKMYTYTSYTNHPLFSSIHMYKYLIMWLCNSKCSWRQTRSLLEMVNLTDTKSLDDLDPPDYPVNHICTPSCARNELQWIFPQNYGIFQVHVDSTVFAHKMWTVTIIKTYYK